uniref:Uncharacterized protein n=1 Tax=Podoviridae sp. ctLPy3 TaxID=2825244 RepID=A0A8S5UWG3_9CAUD|nr:MAG TPA: hypothetical protein [Podoviridae sp. ctLPy3]
MFNYPPCFFKPVHIPLICLILRRLYQIYCENYIEIN